MGGMLYILLAYIWVKATRRHITLANPLMPPACDDVKSAMLYQYPGIMQGFLQPVPSEHYVMFAHIGRKNSAR